MEKHGDDSIRNISKLDYQRKLANTKSDLTSVRRRLNAKKRVLSSLKTEAEVAQYLGLLNSPKVVKYLGTSAVASKLEREESDLNHELELLSQLMCKHPALLVTEEVAYDGGVYTTCKCLECKQVVNSKDNNLDPNALIYIKPRTGFYFVPDEEVKRIEAEYKGLRTEKKYSPRRLVKEFNNQGN